MKWLVSQVSTEHGNVSIEILLCILEYLEYVLQVTVKSDLFKNDRAKAESWYNKYEGDKAEMMQILGMLKTLKIEFRSKICYELVVEVIRLGEQIF